MYIQDSEGNKIEIPKEINENILKNPPKGYISRLGNLEYKVETSKGSYVVSIEVNLESKVCLGIYIGDNWRGAMCTCFSIRLGEKMNLHFKDGDIEFELKNE